MIRGDIPHFCNFVKPCSVYDKVTGHKVLENTDLLDLLSNYGLENVLQVVGFTVLECCRSFLINWFLWADKS